MLAMSNAIIDVSHAKVLMVDDTPANIDVLRKVLAPDGYKLSFATSGDKALNLIHRSTPDLILLDVMMPGIDGFETCRQLKEAPEYQQIPVIFITAKTDADDLIAGFKAGAVDYITKPFREEEVRVRVRTHLQTRILLQQRDNLIGNLKASEERFRLLAMWSPVGIFQIDKHGKHSYTNDKWRTILGLTEGIPVENWFDIIETDEERQTMLAEWKACETTLQDCIQIFKIKIPETNEIRWIQQNIAPLINDDNSIDGLVGTLEDITERKLEENRIVEAKETAEAEIQAKADFLAGMTHELRTPLNAIIGYSEMLLEDSRDTEDIDDIEKITTASKYLLGLINDVLDLSKVEANKMSLALDEFNIHPLLHEVTATIRPLVEKNSNRLIVEVEQDIAAMTADQTKVRQILYNLLSNACKFTKNGTITLMVRQHHNDQLLLSVADTGVGISEKEQKHLFQKYSQVGTKKAGGTGLGLVLTKQFTEMMGGEVRLESEEGKGSCFSVLLPLKVSEEATIPL